jgi:hypothetical protein
LEIKIIYLGDLQQLPPVSEHESLIFSLVPEKYNYTVEEEKPKTGPENKIIRFKLK